MLTDIKTETWKKAINHHLGIYKGRVALGNTELFLPGFKWDYLNFFIFMHLKYFLALLDGIEYIQVNITGGLEKAVLVEWTGALDSGSFV